MRQHLLRLSCWPILQVGCTNKEETGTWTCSWPWAGSLTGEGPALMLIFPPDEDCIFTTDYAPLPSNLNLNPSRLVAAPVLQINVTLQTFPNPRANTQHTKLHMAPVAACVLVCADPLQNLCCPLRSSSVPSWFLSHPALWPSRMSRPRSKTQPVPGL